jgi:hypothetical protein
MFDVHEFFSMIKIEAVKSYRVARFSFCILNIFVLGKKEQVTCSFSPVFPVLPSTVYNTSFTTKYSHLLCVKLSASCFEEIEIHEFVKSVV